MGSIFSGSSKSSTNTSQSQQQTTQPLVPTDISSAMSQYFGSLGSYANGINPSNAASTFVPAATADQQAAYNSAATLGTAANQEYGQAANTLGQVSSSNPYYVTNTNVGTTPTSTAASLLTNNGGVNSYLSPYLGDVLGTTMATEALQNGEQNAALENQGASSNAFGSSRFGIAQSNLAAQQALTDATTNSGLLNQGYDTALSADESDTANQQQTNLANQAAQLSQSQLQANLNNTDSLANQSSYNTWLQNLINAGQAQTTNATAQDAAANQNISTQLAAGQDQRSIQAQQDAAYLQYISTIQGLIGVNPASTFGQTGTASGQSSSTTDTTTTPSLFQDLTSLLGSSSTTSASGAKSTGLASLFAG